MQADHFLCGLVGSENSLRINIAVYDVTDVCATSVLT